MEVIWGYVRIYVHLWSLNITNNLERQKSRQSRQPFGSCIRIINKALKISLYSFVEWVVYSRESLDSVKCKNRTWRTREVSPLLLYFFSIPILQNNSLYVCFLLSSAQLIFSNIKSQFVRFPLKCSFEMWTPRSCDIRSDYFSRFLFQFLL